MSSKSHDSNPKLYLIAQFLHGVLFLLIFIGPTVSFTHNRKIQAVVSVAAFIISLFLVRKELVYFDTLIIIYIGILILWTIIILDSDWLTNRHIYHTISAIALAILFRTGNIRRTTITIPFLILSLGSLLMIIFFHENLADGAFFYLNRNSFVKILLVYAALIAIFDYNQGLKRPEIWPSILTFLIGSLSNSRGGLGISIIYLIFILTINAFYFYKKNIQFKFYLKPYKALILILGLLIALGISLYAISKSPFMTKGISSSGRIDIILSYLHEVTLLKFFTGFRPSIYDVYNHMHNSYLTLLTLNGFGAFPFFILLAYLLYRLWKRSFLLFGILVIFCFYSLFEHVFFFNIADYLIFMLAQYLLMGKEDLPAIFSKRLPLGFKSK